MQFCLQLEETKLIKVTGHFNVQILPPKNLAITEGSRAKWTCHINGEKVCLFNAILYSNILLWEYLTQFKTIF